MDDLQKIVLGHFENDEMCYYYRYFTGKMPDVPLKEIKKAMQKLKEFGYVELVRGLVSEDGPGYYGSGFQLTYPKGVQAQRDNGLKQESW